MDSPEFASAPFRHGKSLQVVSTSAFGLIERTFKSKLEVPVHSHTRAHVVITLRGKYVQKSGGKTLEFTPWTVCFYPVGESHSSSYSQLGARSLHVDIPPETLERVRDACPSLDGPLFFYGGKPALIGGEIYREFRALDSTSPLVLEGLILQLFGEMCRIPQPTHDHPPSWLTRADTMICERFTEMLTLSDIAGHVGVHPVHLARQYRKHFRFTVGERIRRLRIDYACRQISTTKLPLADIALASGFFDQSHFAVAFKNQVGTPPSVYRRAVRDC